MTGSPFQVRDVQPRLQCHDHPWLQHLVLALGGAVVRVHAQPMACNVTLPGKYRDVCHCVLALG